ncbi:MAG: UbiD family decarboxylase [Rhodospirillales bacterium]|jgi:4-hydroxy-3-polyprenylbenzoate decarboxylase|nr:UbiD family decarboxylase [Rhodospirillales bacterium]MDP6645688.1 UbiD family decarboxylase [Rhodospirillales bacterium]
MSTDTNTGRDDNIRHHLTYRDLRDWIAEADRMGELRHVSGASWQSEIGMAAAIVCRDDDAPAVLFDEVPGCAKGFRVLVNLFGGGRKNMSLGFPAGLGKVELSDAFAAVFSDPAELIPPVEVDDGPVLENVMLGDEVDLDIFPTPLWHEKDGGRYIGTGSYNVTRDPDTGWVNLGCYRIMVKDRNTVGHNVLPGRHANDHNRKYTERGERMPMVMVVGGDPMTFFMAASSVPGGIGEYDVVGRMRGRPLEVVRGRVTGLPFPADAEIVLEGYVDRDRIEPEGPFGDWTGTYTEAGRINPVVDIKAVYHRNDPILLGFAPQCLPDEFSRFAAITHSAYLKRDIEAAGVPDVKAVWCHEVGGGRMLVAIAISQRYAGHAKQAGHAASMCGSAAGGNRWVIVTDDDIDVANLEELIYAALTRADPATSIDLITGAPGSVSDPRLAPSDREQRNFTNSRLIIDACRPYHWRDQFPEVNKPSPELAQLARQKFGHLVEGGAA